MASFLEELNKLANPAPVFKDPEEDVDDVTSAKVVGENQVVNYKEKPGDVEVSKLRQKNTILLAETDIKYRGRKTSRKSLQDNDVSRSAILEDVIGPPPSEDDSDGAEEGDNGDEEDVGPLEINAFREQLKLKTGDKKIDAEFALEDYGKYGNDESDEMEEDDDGDDSDRSSEESDDNEYKVQEEAETEDISSFSKTNITEEMEKGKAAKYQIAMWDSLLEARIKLQKSLTLVNQLPQPDTWPTFLEEGGDNFEDTARQCQSAVKTLLDNLVQLQTLLFVSNPETKHMVSGNPENTESSSKRADSDDEEITSESESEEKPIKAISPKIPEKWQLKRKLKFEDYPEFLAKRHADFTPYRNAMIQKWSDKTRLAMGKFSSKSFSAFEQSTLKQIEQILADQDRLIRRTQLKRTVYRVLGREDQPQKEEATAENTETEETNISDDQLKTHDEEIFDDDDFYHQLLRELIERKTTDISDPVALSRQWLEIQRLRTRVKKRVDTKASKGRKIRYDAHKKLVNFMAPMDNCTWPQESRDDLFKSLFGKRFGSCVVNR